MIINLFGGIGSQGVSARVARHVRRSREVAGSTPSSCAGNSILPHPGSVRQRTRLSGPWTPSWGPTGPPIGLARPSDAADPPRQICWTRMWDLFVRLVGVIYPSAYGTRLPGLSVGRTRPWDPTVMSVGGI
jgi:hypothetical protein